MKKASTSIDAVRRSGRPAGTETWAGILKVASIILCRLGSCVNFEEPIALSTIIRMSCRYDSVAESPTYSDIWQSAISLGIPCSRDLRNRPVGS